MEETYSNQEKIKSFKLRIVKTFYSSPVLAGLLGPIPDDLGVDGARDAVVEFGVQLGELVAGVDRRL